MLRYIEPHAIIKSRFGSLPRPDWEAVVLIFRDARGSAIIKDALGVEQHTNRVFWGMEQPFTHILSIGKKTIGVIEQCIWGGPQTSILVEEIAELGIKKIIGIGACGSVISSLPKGSQVIACESFITDGTSGHYTKESSSFPSKNLMSIAEKMFPNKLKMARASSVDAIYRETIQLVDNLKKLGTEIINMESSALYSASSLCGVESIWIGHVSDCIVENNWQNWDNIENMAEESAKICRDLLESNL